MPQFVFAGQSFVFISRPICCLVVLGFRENSDLYHILQRLSISSTKILLLNFNFPEYQCTNVSIATQSAMKYILEYQMELSVLILPQQ